MRPGFGLAAADSRGVDATGRTPAWSKSSTATDPSRPLTPPRRVSARGGGGRRSNSVFSAVGRGATGGVPAVGVRHGDHDRDDGNGRSATAYRVPRAACPSRPAPAVRSCEPAGGEGPAAGTTKRVAAAVDPRRWRWGPRHHRTSAWGQPAYGSVSKALADRRGRNPRSVTGLSARLVGRCPGGWDRPRRPAAVRWALGRRSMSTGASGRGGRRGTDGPFEPDGRAAASADIGTGFAIGT